MNNQYQKVFFGILLSLLVSEVGRHYIKQRQRNQFADLKTVQC